MGRDEIRLADEVGDESRARSKVDLFRIAQLDDAARIEHGDLVTHGHRLTLIMRDEHEGDRGFALQSLQLCLHAATQLQIECGQGLVEKQNFRVLSQRASEGHSLLLAAGELRRLARAQARQSNHLERLPHLSLDVGLADLVHLQAEGDVLRDGHMREECVGLENGVDPALPDGHVVDALPAEQDLAPIRGLQTGDAAQQRGLAAARRPEKHHEGSVAHLEADVVESPDLAALRCGERLGDVGDAQR